MPGGVSMCSRIGTPLPVAAERPGTLDAAFDAASSVDLDLDEGAAAVAAAAIVAAAFDGEVSDLDDEARALSGAVVADARLRARAVEALDRVLAPKSELASLWGNGGARFRHRVEQLRTRLKR
jgi:hypothetical protein